MLVNGTAFLPCTTAGSADYILNAYFYCNNCY